MNKQEFESRIGRSATDAEFERADRVYMAAQNNNKDTFCNEWKNLKLKQSEVLGEITDGLQNMQEIHDKEEVLIEKLVRILASYCDNDELSDTVAGIIGHARWIRAKLEVKGELTNSDAEYIKNYLK